MGRPAEARTRRGLTPRQGHLIRTYLKIEGGESIRAQEITAAWRRSLEAIFELRSASDCGQGKAQAWRIFGNDRARPSVY